MLDTFFAFTSGPRESLTSLSIRKDAPTIDDLVLDALGTVVFPRLISFNLSVALIRYGTPSTLEKFFAKHGQLQYVQLTYLDVGATAWRSILGGLEANCRELMALRLGWLRQDNQQVAFGDS